MKKHRNSVRNACAASVGAAPTPEPALDTPGRLHANARSATGTKPRRSVTRACFVNAKVAPTRVPAPATPVKPADTSRNWATCRFGVFAYAPMQNPLLGILHAWEEATHICSRKSA